MEVAAHRAGCRAGRRILAPPLAMCLNPATLLWSNVATTTRADPFSLDFKVTKLTTPGTNTRNCPVYILVAS